MPRSEQWNIRIAAHCYIKGGKLQEGEKLFFVNGIQRKCLHEWHGQTCKYVAVKYTFRKANGYLDQRIIIHPLMTEHCDSIIDCSYDGKAEWVKSDDLLNKEPRRLLFEVLKMAATYSPTNAVPSALLSLTTLFGMGRGGTSAL